MPNLYEEVRKDRYVAPSDLKVLQDSDYYFPNSSRDTYVLKEEFEKVVHSPEFKVLGCLNGYIFTNEGAYVGKATMDGAQIAKINLEVSHGSFYEGCNHFYCWFEKTLYKVTDQLEIEWSKEFDLYISSVTIDYRGDCYILFESSRTIRKILKSGEESVYIDGSDDPTATVIIHRLFVTKGGGWLYALCTKQTGYNDVLTIYIDKYNTRTWEQEERITTRDSSTYLIKQIFTTVDIEDPLVTFIDFTLSGDYFYLVSQKVIFRLNLKGFDYWYRYTGYEDGEFTKIEFTDNPYTDDFHYIAKVDDLNWYKFGKSTINGNTLWESSSVETDDDVDFNMAYYQNKIYTTLRAYVQPKKGYILSLDDDKIVFKSRNGHLVKIVQYNDEEIYSADNYYGYRLLADEIKEGIEKIEYVPLLHDDGDMVNEDEDLLLIGLENEDYTNLDNYNYKYILASRYRIDPPEISLLYTKALQPILTKLKNTIKTKSPVLPDTVHEFITDTSGKYLDTSKDFDLVRSRFRYSFDKYLLADINMFSTDIITKDLGYTIITKKYGHDIIMKTRKIYSYVFTKYDELDLLAEWLKENGVMDTKLPDYVEELKHHTLDAIQDIQIAGTPQIYDVQAYKQFEYTFNGYKYQNNTWGTQIFSCTNLPWDKRKCVAKIYIDSLANIIKKQEMRPILFFLNGKAIPWSDCTIVRDWSYSYLLIKNHDPYESELSSIIFPCDIRYGEDNKILNRDQINGYFYFNKNGKYVSGFSDIKIRVEIIDKNIWGYPTYDTPCNLPNTGISKYEVLNKEDQLATDVNIIVFENNILIPDAKYYRSWYGKDVYSRQGKDGNPTFTEKAFYWIKGNSYLGLEEKPENQAMMLEDADGGKIQPRNKELSPLFTPFNFKMDRKKKYEDNIANAISYIMQYDSSLLIKYWKDLANTSSFVFEGEYLINRVPKDGGWLLIPRSRKSNLDDYVMVFRNNRLYEYYKEIDYTDCYFKIPIFNHVERDDIIEVIHFKGIDNNYYTLTVDKDEPDYLPENLRYDNFLLSGNSPSSGETYIIFNRETSIQYDIGFKYKNNFKENGKYLNTDIELEDDFYYNKEINIYSKRQFHYMYYNIFSPKTEINLSPDFRFCHEKSKYMVFVNGCKISPEKWELILMTNEVKRKYISIQFNFKLIEEDLVEIFYLPVDSTVEEVNLQYDDSQDRNLVYSFTHDSFGLPFDKDLFHVYIDGYKLNYTEVDNVSKDKFSIKGDIARELYETSSWIDEREVVIRAGKYNTVELISYVSPETLLKKLYSYTDLWSDTISDMKQSTILKLIKRVPESEFRGK